MIGRLKTKKQVVRIAGKLKEVITVHDALGNLVHKMISPIMVEFHLKDVVQLIVGASVLAVPVSFTEETWKLGEVLPNHNIIALATLSIFFIAIFVYYNYYRNRVKDHWPELVKRVLSTYIISFIVVALILTLIQKAPWQVDLILALKRVVLVTFPASMSAAVADMIK